MIWKKSISKLAESNGHDGSIALVVDGQLKKHVTAERINHIKHSSVDSDTRKYFGNDWHDNDLGISVLSECHHLFHAAHAFYDSGFKKSLCIVVDGMGSHVELNSHNFLKGSYGRESMSAYIMEYPAKNDLVYREICVPFECDLMTDYLKTYVQNTISPALMFQVTCKSWGMNWYDAGKIMAMASYGTFSKKILESDSLFEIGDNLHDIKLNYKAETFEEKCNFAKTLQVVCQDRVRLFISKAIEYSGVKDICMSGGFFLNCVSNSYIQQNLPDDCRTFIEPVSGDDGISIGLSKLMWYEETQSTKRYPLKNIYNGIPQELNVEGDKTTPKEVAKLLDQGKVVAIFQSRSESGPRALGNRSILYDPRDSDGRDKINKLKGREDYRPLAATVLQQHAHKWFDMIGLKESPYMLYALKVLSDKVPAISHVDDTCRVQTLKRSQNRHYYDLINEFYKLTKVPMVLNTSFNLAGDTIVETLDDAIRTLNNSDIDYLYIPERRILIS